MRIIRFDRYEKNLCMIGNDLFSYSTHVGIINKREGTLKKLGWWSATTSKHINYAAKELNLKVVEL